MADVTLTYNGSDILELSDSGSATLKTGGKYCEDDIAVEYVKPSGGGGLTPSILDGVSFEGGYISTSGSISAQQSTTKEVVFDYIPCEGGNTLFVFLVFGQTASPWIGVGEYTESSEWIERGVFSTTTSVRSYEGQIVIPQNCKKLRISLRTYGKVKIYATYGSLNSYDVVTSIEPVEVIV